jgi:hypothetical protein
VRHILISVIPTLVLLIIVVYLNSWKARELEMTTSTFVRVGTQTLADNVNAFFADKLIFVGQMREFIRSGVWMDVSDIDTYAQQVIPILTHHPSYRGVYQRMTDGTQVIAHKPMVTSGTAVIDLGLNLRKISTGEEVRYTRQHWLNFTGTIAVWDDWVLRSPQTLTVGPEGMAIAAPWFLYASGQQVRVDTPKTSTLKRRIPYWGSPQEAGADNAIYFSIRVDWPVTRDPTNTNREFTTFKFQFYRLDMDKLLLAGLPYGVEAVIIDTVSLQYIMYSRTSDGYNDIPMLNFKAFKVNPTALGTYNFSAQLAGNVTVKYKATPLGNDQQGLSKWHLVTINTNLGEEDDHLSVLGRVSSAFAKLSALGTLVEYFLQSRLLDDPEDISDVENIMIPAFISHPMISSMKVVQGTGSSALTFTRNSKTCDVMVQYYNVDGILQRRYAVGPLSSLQDWTVSPKGDVAVPQWFTDAQFPKDDDVSWELPEVDPDLCPTLDLSACLESPDFFQDTLVIPLYFTVTWPYPHDRTPTSPLDKSLFAFAFTLRTLHQVVKDLALDAVGGAACIFHTATMQVVISSTSVLTGISTQKTQQLTDLPVFKKVSPRLLQTAVRYVTYQVHVYEEYYIQVFTLTAAPAYSVIFLVHETSSKTTTFSRTEYYIDGLIIAVVICFAIHVAYVLIHVNDVKRVAKMVEAVSDLRFDKINASMLSFSCATEIRRMQHSVLSLMTTMEKLRPFLGPLRNIAIADSSYELNRISVLQGCENRCMAILFLRHCTHEGITPPSIQCLDSWERIVVANGGRVYFMDGVLVGLWEEEARANAVHAMFQVEIGPTQSGLVVASIGCGNAFVGNLGGEAGRSFTVIGTMIEDMKRLGEYALNVLSFSVEGMVVQSPSVVCLASSRFPLHANNAVFRKLGTVWNADNPWTVLNLVREKDDVPLSATDMGIVCDHLHNNNVGAARDSLGSMDPPNSEWERMFQQKLQMCVQRRDKTLIDMGV